MQTLSNVTGWKEVCLNGNSKDRRKQFRKIKKINKCVIRKNNKAYIKPVEYIMFVSTVKMGE